MKTGIYYRLLITCYTLHPLLVTWLRKQKIELRSQKPEYNSISYIAKKKKSEDRIKNEKTEMSLRGTK